MVCVLYCHIIIIVLQFLKLYDYNLYRDVSGCINIALDIVIISWCDHYGHAPVSTRLVIRAGLRHWGPHAKVSWGPFLFLPSPSLSGLFLRPPLSPLPLPLVPSSAISLPSFYLFSFEVAT